MIRCHPRSQQVRRDGDAAGHGLRAAFEYRRAHAFDPVRRQSNVVIDTQQNVAARRRDACIARVGNTRLQLFNQTHLGHARQNRLAHDLSRVVFRTVIDHYEFAAIIVGHEDLRQRSQCFAQALGTVARTYKDGNGSSAHLFRRHGYSYEAAKSGAPRCNLTVST